MEFHIDGVDGGFVWRALDEAGRVLAVSPPFASRKECLRAVLELRVEAPTARVFDLAADAPIAPRADPRPESPPTGSMRAVPANSQPWRFGRRSKPRS